jgi:hypothetical protein
MVTMIGNEVVGEPAVRKLDAYDVLVRRNEAVRILDKVPGYRVRRQARTEPWRTKSLQGGPSVLQINAARQTRRE